MNNIILSFDKSENDIACLIIMRKNSDGSMTYLKEFYGEEAEALYNFLTKPVVIPTIGKEVKPSGDRTQDCTV